MSINIWAISWKIMSPKSFKNRPFWSHWRQLSFESPGFDPQRRKNIFRPKTGFSCDECPLNLTNHLPNGPRTRLRWTRSRRYHSGRCDALLRDRAHRVWGGSSAGQRLQADRHGRRQAALQRRAGRIPATTGTPSLHAGLVSKFVLNNVYKIMIIFVLRDLRHTINLS